MYTVSFNLLQTLSSLGILPALEITLAADDAKTKTASIDILTYIVEFSPSVVRDYTLQQTSNTDEVSCLVTFQSKEDCEVIVSSYLST